jgi:hypothetical protein
MALTAKHAAATWNPVKIAGAPIEIRTEHLANMRLERDRYANPRSR